ncbi:MAG: hypothetical protein R3B70_37040 [Polyangiaceae bacterium]
MRINASPSSTFSLGKSTLRSSLPTKAVRPAQVVEVLFVVQVIPDRSGRRVVDERLHLQVEDALADVVRTCSRVHVLHRDVDAVPVDADQLRGTTGTGGDRVDVCEREVFLDVVVEEHGAVNRSLPARRRGRDGALYQCRGTARNLSG